MIEANKGRNLEEGGIAVLDFGGQYSHLICRRIRALGVYSVLLPYDTPAAELKERKFAGAVLSGGPASVYAKSAPRPDSKVFGGSFPLLGICYGYQLLIQAHGGEVERASSREYGKATLTINNKSGLFRGIEKDSMVCWMSHGDSATVLPKDIEVLAVSKNSPFAAVRSRDGLQYGVQFHPEVVHTQNGDAILSNFAFEVCGAQRNWSMNDFVEETTKSLAKKIDGRVLCAVSGGVDSSVTAALLHRAIGPNLQCVFIDHGLLREGEAEDVQNVLKEGLKIPLHTIDASAEFLSALKGVKDPEEKRKIIGAKFAAAFEGYVRKSGPFRYLAQGTLYPDVIESGGRSNAPTSVIKTHHNVGGLPKDLSLEVVEPLKELYKDEVREMGAILGIPEDILMRHPFPGPGLAVRIVGEVTEEKLRVCRHANKIVEDVLKERGYYGKAWQAFAYLGDDLITGVMGDERKLAHQLVVKAIDSVDGMTADWVRLPFEVLEEISTRISNEVPGVVGVAYNISSKPPATIEPQ